MLTLAAPSLNAQTFQTAQPLFFTMPYQGANPLPQVLTVASTAASFNFRTAVSTTSGGAWLTTSSGFNPTATPFGVAVSVTTVASMAPGTYTGTINFTSISTPAINLDIAVTLAIESPTATFFDSLPGEFSFFAPTNGNAPPAQALQIRRAGGGTLNWTINTTSSDGGNWLSVSSSRGVAPATIGVAVNLSNPPYGGRAAGTYTGQITVHTSGNTVTIPVSVLVGPMNGSIFQQANPLNFTMPFQVANPLPQILTVADTSSSFSFRTSVSTAAGGSWLKTSSGFNPISTPYGVSVSIAPATALAVGVYTGEINFQSTDQSMTMTVPVTLTVEPPSATFLDNLPGQLSFFMLARSSAPAVQALQVRSTDGGTLDWTSSISTSDGGNWLSLSSAGGTTPSTINVAINLAGLPYRGQAAGTYTGQVLFQTSESAITIPISVLVGPANGNIFQQANPLNFTMPFQGANPLPQILTVASTGASFSFRTFVSTATGGAWLTASSGFNPTATPYGATVGIASPTNMASGTYTGEIIFQSTDNSMIMTVPVTLTVEPSSATFFDSLPGQLSFFGKPDGTAIPTRSLQIRNGGTGTLGWTLITTTSDGGDWLAASSASGTTPALVTISIVPSLLPYRGLASGTYSAQIILQTADDRVTIPVTVSLGTSTFQQQPGLSFTMPQGGINPTPQTLTVASTGAAFSFRTAVFTSTGGSWLKTDIGFNPTGTPYGVSVSVTALTSIEAGKYTGEIVFQSTDQSMTMTIPVTLFVVAPVALNFAAPAFIPNGASSGAPSLQAATGDFNNDGFPDLVLTNTLDATASLLLGKGDGAFQAPSTFAVGNGPYGVAAGDFNGDGKPDVAVVNGLDNTVSILLNGATGLPAKPSSTYAVGSQPYGVAVADLNRDGKLDLIVTNNASKTLSVLFGNGDGTFQAAVSSTTGNYPFVTAVADVNNDGYPDLIVQNFGDNTVGVFLNTGAGTFLPQMTYATGTGPFYLTTGDFNGDGYPDIAVANLGANGFPGKTVSILLNDKSGKFLAAQSYATGLDPSSVLTRDLNGDGVLDLATTNLGDNTVSVLLGKGDGTFLAQTVYPAGTQPYAITAGDFNGDGLPDLVVTSFFDNTVGVLIQVPPAGTTGRVRGSPSRTQKPLQGPQGIFSKEPNAGDTRGTGG